MRLLIGSQKETVIFAFKLEFKATLFFSDSIEADDRNQIKELKNP